MAIFAISFRIGDEGDRNERWASLVAQIRAEAAGQTWEETTSFFIIGSDKTTDTLASALYTNSTMSSTYDKLLVVNLSVKSHAKKGAIKYPATLDALMAAR